MTNTLSRLACQPRSWAAALLTALVTGAAMAAPVYRVIDLGALYGKGASRASALNAKGDTVGDALARKTGALRPVLFGKGQPLDLITATGTEAVEGWATAINRSGDIAGRLVMRTGGVTRPFIYRQGALEVVDATACACPELGLSDLGHLLVNDWGKSDLVSRVRQPDGTWVPLKRWNGSDWTVGLAINRRGNLVVGYARRDFEFSQAVVWRSNKPEAVPGTEGSTVSHATAVNDRGDVAGDRSVLWDTYGGSRAFVVRDGVLTDLTGPNLFSVATGLDNQGRVVGNVYDLGSTDPSAFLSQEGQTMVLDDLVQPAQQGLWQIKQATGINDAGEIAARGVSTVTGQTHALKLVPVAAP